MLYIDSANPFSARFPASVKMETRFVLTACQNQTPDLDPDTVNVHDHVGLEI